MLQTHCALSTGSGSSSYDLFEDDGETQGYRSGKCATVHVEMRWDEKSVQVKLSKSGNYQLPYQTVALHLADNDTRAVTVNGKPLSKAELASIGL